MSETPREAESLLDVTAPPRGKSVMRAPLIVDTRERDEARVALQEPLADPPERRRS